MFDFLASFVFLPVENMSGPDAIISKSDTNTKNRATESDAARTLSTIFVDAKHIIELYN